MYGTRATEDGDSIISLVRETADGLGRLVGDHIKLARLELVSDLKAYVRQSVLLTAMVIFLALGYALGCVGLALVLAQWWGAMVGFFVVAGFHLVLGGIGLAIGVRNLRQTHLMDETLSEVGRSVSTLSGRLTNGGGPRADHHREGSRA
ncbi:MAG TPA: phage holin family protein [Polyangia bacterium]|jgi:uncharacterized membrane protein YqjE|nr:phage holin family protein [Polyangia bacterium]